VCSSDLEAEIQDIDLYKLLKIYQKVMKRYEEEQNKPSHSVVQYPYTIEKQKDFLLKELQTHKRLSFEAIIDYNPQKIAVVYNFLAILELLQNRLVMLYGGDDFNSFWIEELEEALIN